jgi:hypothetical protein
MTRTGREITRDFGLWSLKCRRESKDLDSHLDELVVELGPNANLIPEIDAAESREVSFFAAAPSMCPSGGSLEISIGEASLLHLARIKAAISISIYYDECEPDVGFA